MPRNPRNHAVRKYPRTARLNELCREIVAAELERIDDERLELVTVTHVRVDPDLRHALVEVSALGEDEDEAIEGLEEHRIRLQRAIGSQARLKRTPELRFRMDEVIERGAHIEGIIAVERERSTDIRDDDV
jgi:ribosome-binding factor A